MSLNLFRCVICKRAFFDESRRNEHTKSEHRKSSYPTSDLTVPETEQSCLNSTTRPVQNCEFSKHKLYKPTSVNTKHSKHRERRNMSRARHYAGRRLSGQFQYLLKHLDQLWPPDKNSKIEGLKRFRKLGWLLSKITGHNYSREKHGPVKIVQVLNHEFCQNKHLNEKRIRDIQDKTGISQLYIKAWFKWKKNLELTTSPKKVLQESFYSCQYPSQETIKTIASVITSTQQKVESWFLISRVIADILDPSANDTKEMVLWRMFHLRFGEGLQNSDVKLASYLLDMKVEIVMKIFQIWCGRFGVANHMDAETYEAGENEMTQTLQRVQTNTKHGSDVVCIEDDSGGKSGDDSIYQSFLRLNYSAEVSDDSDDNVMVNTAKEMPHVAKESSDSLTAEKKLVKTKRLVNTAENVEGASADETSVVLTPTTTPQAQTPMTENLLTNSNSFATSKNVAVKERVNAVENESVGATNLVPSITSDGALCNNVGKPSITFNPYIKLEGNSNEANKEENIRLTDIIKGTEKVGATEATVGNRHWDVKLEVRMNVTEAFETQNENLSGGMVARVVIPPEERICDERIIYKGIFYQKETTQHPNSSNEHQKILNQDKDFPSQHPGTSDHQRDTLDRYSDSLPQHQVFLDKHLDSFNEDFLRRDPDSSNQDPKYLEQQLDSLGEDQEFSDQHPDFLEQDPNSLNQHPDLSDHSLIHEVLRKLRRKQRKRGIPPKVNVAGVALAHHLVGKAKKKKLSQLKNYRSFLEEKTPRDDDVIFVGSWTKPKLVKKKKMDLTSVLRSCVEDDITFSRNIPHGHGNHYVLELPSIVDPPNAVESLYQVIGESQGTST
ncbi:uncharacterized protein LOC100184831 [Ciona intestinalis]